MKSLSIAFSIERNSGMNWGDLADLIAFVAVADQLSFRARRGWVSRRPR
jgi:hypothetical protein